MGGCLSRPQDNANADEGNTMPYAITLYSPMDGGDCGENHIEEDHISLSRFARPNESNCEVNGGKGDFFDLLSLPNEMISNVFSFLPIKDRMRARLNMRLYKIEEGNKYYVDSVTIFISELFSCNLINGARCDDELIGRIAPMTTVKMLFINFPGEEEHVRAFSSLVKKFKRIEVINFQFNNQEMIDEIIIDPFFLDFARKCKKFKLSSAGNITPEALHKVYQDMISESTNLRSLSVERYARKNLDSLLKLVGIEYREGTFVCSRKIEVYRSTDECSVHIFDGMCEIILISRYDEDYLSLYYKMYENLETIEYEKKRLMFFDYDSVEVVSS